MRYRTVQTPLVLILLVALTGKLHAASFRFADINPDSVGLWEGDRPVLVYNHGVISKTGVPDDRKRSCYLHPIYGLDGEVLTDDFPRDHYHHRGLFWAWPHIKIGGKEYSTWDIKGIHQRFSRWLAKEAGGFRATLGVENGWMLGQDRLVTEHVWLRVHPATNGTQAIDVELTIVPEKSSLTLAGAEGKSYGGLTLRFAPRTNTVITTPLGNGKEDLPMTRLPWADLTAQFAKAPAPSGAAVFIGKDHPDYPPTWLTRHYGVLCVGWPGVDAQTFPPGKPIRCRYRIWVHRGEVTKTQLESAYANYISTKSK